MLMTGELPEDLVTQILVCLPVVSLLRFKSVCKSWYALITQQNFITKHLLHNNNNNSNTFLFKIRDKTTEDHFVSTLSYETHQVSVTQPVPLPFFGIRRCVITVEGSCNGLICLRYSAYEFNVVIWNPATKETKVVPQSNLPRVAPAGYRANCDGIGFGFDAKTNDYKIINFLSISDPDTPFDLFENEVVIYQTEVYSLSSDSWTKVDGPPCSVRSNGSQIYINGMASWKEFDDDCESFVLSFDMSDEVFLQTPLPDEVTRELSASWNLFVLNESIAMAVSIWNRNRNFSYESSFHIWSLLEVGVKNSWTKLLTIEPVEIPRFRRSLGLWNNEIMLFEKYEHQLAVYDLSPKEFTDLQIVNGVIPSSRSQLALYDLSTKEITDLQIGNGVTPSSQSQLVTYMESLVSLKSRTILEGPSFYI